MMHNLLVLRTLIVKNYLTQVRAIITIFMYKQLPIGEEKAEVVNGLT